MPYRSLPQDAPEDPRLVRELAALAVAASQRQRRAAVAVTSVVTGGLLALVGALGASSTPPHLACHRVEIRWENAPEVPGSAWTSCTTR